MKLPNGYGSVTKMSGMRRKPYRVRKSIGWEEKEGRKKQLFVNIGTYRTREDALQALAKYNNDPDMFDLSQTKLSEIYDSWSKEKFSQLGEASIYKYKLAWNNICRSLWNMKVSDIKLSHMQQAADNSGLNRPSLYQYKCLMSALMKYAVIHEIIPASKDVTKYIDISKFGNPNKRNHCIFTTEEVEKVWKSDYYPSKFFLLMIYSGCRIGELLDLKKDNICLKEQYFTIIHSKTKAGVRNVPIADKIMPIIKDYHNKSGCDHLICENDVPMKYTDFVNHYWKPGMKYFDMDHKPHDTRYTCVTMLTSAGVDERIVKKIIGHKKKDDVTQEVYTNFEIKVLLDAINKI